MGATPFCSVALGSTSCSILMLVRNAQDAGQNYCFILLDSFLADVCPLFACQGGAAQGKLPGITNLAWNPKVPHILATCTETGVVKVWDLKKRSTIMDLADNQGCVAHKHLHACSHTC